MLQLYTICYCSVTLHVGFCPWNRKECIFLVRTGAASSSSLAVFGSSQRKNKRRGTLPAAAALPATCSLAASASTRLHSTSPRDASPSSRGFLGGVLPGVDYLLLASLVVLLATHPSVDCLIRASLAVGILIIIIIIFFFFFFFLLFLLLLF
jgi:hypothetical protein